MFPSFGASPSVQVRTVTNRISETFVVVVVVVVVVVEWRHDGHSPRNTKC